MMQMSTFMHSTCLLYKVMAGGVATTTPLLVEFEDLPYPWGRSYTPRFCIKMTAKDARAATFVLKIILRKNRAFYM